MVSIHPGFYLRIDDFEIFFSQVYRGWLETNFRNAERIHFPVWKIGGERKFDKHRDRQRNKEKVNKRIYFPVWKIDDQRRFDRQKDRVTKSFGR